MTRGRKITKTHACVCWLYFSRKPMESFLVILALLMVKRKQFTSNSSNQRKRQKRQQKNRQLGKCHESATKIPKHHTQKSKPLEEVISVDDCSENYRTECDDETHDELNDHMTDQNSETGTTISEVDGEDSLSEFNDESRSSASYDSMTDHSDIEEGILTGKKVNSEKMV